MIRSAKYRRRACSGSVALFLVSTLAIIPWPEPAWSQNYYPIVGSPLRINVGEDLTFQIFHSGYPGGGQIYPESSPDLADMGVFVRTGGHLYTADFGAYAHPVTEVGLVNSDLHWTNQSLVSATGNGAQ